MTRQSIWKLGLTGCFLCLFSGAALSPAAAQDEGIAERLGAQIDEGIDTLGNELRQGWASLRRTVNRMGVQGRVYSRLRWDKDIATDAIDVNVNSDGIVELVGRVTTADAKQKAVRLANDTVGVDRVIDRLTVAAPAASVQP